MKTLLFILLLTISFTIQAGYRTVYVCDSRGNCEYITIYEYEPVRNNANNIDHNELMGIISNSGAKNYNQFQRYYNPNNRYK